MMWLPTELWVDAFKMLARRDLVQRVQPTCRRMHAICERHVHSIHPILEFYTFLDALVSNAPEAHKQLADLRASNANLFAHFELCSEEKWHCFSLQFGGLQTMTHDYYQLCILRLCPELFRDHTVLLDNSSQTLAPTALQYYLSALQPLETFYIGIEKWGQQNVTPEWLQMDVLMREPCILECPRLLLLNELGPTERMPTPEHFCDWLHHLPSESNGTQKQHSRIMELALKIVPNIWNIERIIELCKQIFAQARSMADQRAFVFLFSLLDEKTHPLYFRLENAQSAELLQFEHVGPVDSDWHHWALRRFRATDLPDADQFYHRTFDFEGRNRGGFKSPAPVGPLVRLR